MTKTEEARHPRLVRKLDMIVKLLEGEELIDALGMLDIAQHKLLTGTLPAAKDAEDGPGKAIKA